MTIAERKYDPLSSQTAMTENALEIGGRVNNYLQWNLELFRLEKGKRILDLGCGPGLYLETILSYRPSQYVAVDIYDDYVNQMRKRISAYRYESFRVDILDRGSLAKLYAHVFDYILFLDVLEHIEDEGTALYNLRKLIEYTGGGLLCLRVPALMHLYGAGDRSIGHYRRYSLKPLKRLLEKHSFSVRHIGYQNLPGILPWFFTGRILKRKLTVSSGEGQAFDSMVPLIKCVENRIPPPVGLSLFCLCTVNSP